jgi:ferric-dicitrate binding protein FerR (iron transport regulator)
MSTVETAGRDRRSYRREARMFVVMVFMKNGNGIRYELSEFEWTTTKATQPSDYLQFRTLKGSTVWLNLRETIAVEFQHESGVIKLAD